MRPGDGRTPSSMMCIKKRHVYNAMYIPTAPVHRRFCPGGMLCCGVKWDGVGRRAGWLVAWLVGRSLVRSVARSVGRRVGGCVGWTVAQRVGGSVGRSRRPIHVMLDMQHHLSCITIDMGQ